MKKIISIRAGVVLAFVPLMLTNANLFAQDLTISAYVNQTTVPLNRQFQLSIELSGSDANNAPQPSPPGLDNFAAYVGSSSSFSTQIINGQMSITKTYIYHFIATTVGKFQIPTVSVTFNGKDFATEPIDIEIVKDQSTAQRQGGQRQAPQSESDDLSDRLFLKASVNKSRVYQNEEVLVTYKIYMDVPVSTYGISQLPNMVGFWNEEFPTSQRPEIHYEMVNGRRFRVAEIKKLALFPQSAGSKTLEPLIIECEVQARAKRNRRSPFDSFFDDSFFGLERTVRKTIASNPVSIEVLPLPAAGKPGDFSGAVGSYSISASVDKDQVKANEAITLKVKLAGTGNIKFLPQPAVKFPSDFEVYDPKISEDIKRTNNQITGSKLYEYVVIPRYPGPQTIKPITFSYFDLATKQYKTLTTDPIMISVAKGDDQFVSRGVGSSKEDVKFIGQDIRFIQTRLPEFQRVRNAFYKSWPFDVLLILPLFGLVGAYGYRRYSDKLSTNLAYARSKKANQMALKRLRTAKKQLQEGNAAEFYGEISKALMGFIGDKFNVPSAGLITDQVEEMLREKGIREEVAQEYLDCLKNSEYRRFAPSESDNGLKGFFERSKNAIIKLEKEL